MWTTHLSNSVVELSGSDNHLHLKDVTFGHAALNQTLKDFLLVQSNIHTEQTHYDFP